VPCTIRLLKVPKTSMGFYEFAEYERLVEAARRAGPVPHLIALLGGEAGLRSGEMIGLNGLTSTWASGSCVCNGRIGTGK
jgi:integrase